MTGYPEPIARPIGALHFELMISFLNPGRDPLTAIWHVRLPPGIEEEQGRRTLIGGTVVPARRKAEASTWRIVAGSPEVYAYRELDVGADLRTLDHHFSDGLRATVAQITVVQRPPPTFPSASSSHLPGPIWPVRETRDFLSVQSESSAVFDARLRHWMATEQQWNFDRSDAQNWRAAIRTPRKCKVSIRLR
jgi:hypothetical protein